jgi:phosphoglycolate phosphatase-like HAD superfamily hydrolase
MNKGCDRDDSLVDATPGRVPAPVDFETDFRRLPPAMQWLLLFDIDGTLVSTGGAGSKAMAVAFEHMYGSSDGLMNLRMAGKTDPTIFKEAVRVLGLPAQPGDLERFHSLYLEHLARFIGNMPGGQVMPGVMELLEACASTETVHVGLLTGNWREGARLKLTGFGLWKWFEVGAFADDSEVRDELLPYAVKRLAQRHGETVSRARTVVIGDTPSDIQCAQPYGARTLAVATGPYDVEDLARHNPDHVVPVLPGAATLELLGIS